MSVKMIKCGCDGFLGNKNAALFQDNEYGVNMRVCTPTTTDKKYRCTVCGKEHSFADEKGKK